MKQVRVGIMGATGAVGREMMKILEEREFPLAELRLLASERSAGKTIAFRGEEIPVYKTEAEAFRGLDIVLGAADKPIAVQYAEAIRAAGAVFVDNSNAFRLNKDVPLIIPEINPEDVKWHSGLISNPNCSTIITLMAVWPIAKLSPIVSMTASTYQAVSGAGIAGPRELLEQTAAVAAGKPCEKKVFSRQIAYNLIPQIGGFQENGYTSEEMKMQNEGRKIMHLPEMKVTCTCVRVPVIRSHSISVSVVTEEKLSLDAVREAIEKAPGCALRDDVAAGIFPTPLEASDQDIVHVGRIRRDLVNENGIALWCVGDQVRKGAATNAVEIAELLL